MGESEIDLSLYQIGTQAQDPVELGDRQFKLATFHSLLPSLKVGDDGLLRVRLGKWRRRSQTGGTYQSKQEERETGNHEVKLVGR
jgi:hypothetical protein